MNSVFTASRVVSRTRSGPNMSSRLFLTSVTRQTVRSVPARAFTISQRSFAETPKGGQGAQNDTPGWEGRHGDDHVLHRDGRDIQSDSSLEARKSKEQGKEGSQGISQKDERNSNQKAKEDHPEAPGPVIGMNDGKLNQTNRTTG